MKRVLVLAAAGAFAAGLTACAQTPTPLSDLLTEAAQKNPEIAAARHAWLASTHLRAQVTTLPNPEFTFQDFSVGGVKPWSGFNASNFAYLGFGVSQKLPYPGKLRLKGKAADREADRQRSEVGLAEASVMGEIKAVYLRLAYLQQTIELIQESRDTLGQIVKSEIFRYRTGSGSQAEILKAQLERTKLLYEATVRSEQWQELEADLKRLLHRPQEAPDIVAEPLTSTTLRYSSRKLLAFARERNPEVQVQTDTVRKDEADLHSARRSGKPDFDIGYMFERTGSNYPAYYMLTLNIVFPRHERTRAKVAEAAELAVSARDRLQAQIDRKQAEVRKQYAAVSSTAEEINGFQHGLIPQAEAAFKAGLAAFETNKQPLVSVLNSLADVLELKREYEQALLEHEESIARLETLTGVELR